MELSCRENTFISNTLLLKSENFKEAVTNCVDLSLDFSKSDLACLFIYNAGQDIPAIYKKGMDPCIKKMNRKMVFVNFIEDCEDIIIVHNKKQNPFTEIFINEDMESAIALPLFYKNTRAILILNSLKLNFYNKEQFDFFKHFQTAAAVTLNNFYPGQTSAGKNPEQQKNKEI